MRSGQVLRAAREAGVEALIVLTPANTYYVSGFRAITYSRPVLAVVWEHSVLIVPELEASHARQRSRFTEIRTYSDTALGGLSGKSTFQLAIDRTVQAMEELGLQGRAVGFEATAFTVDGHAYLREAWAGPLVPVRGIVEKLRLVKDEDELRLIRIGCELAEHGMGVEVEASVPGATEIEIMARGNAAMLEMAARRYPELHIAAGSRPVSGEKSVLPHSIPSGRRLAPGDVVIHGTGCVVEGYSSEDERTIFVGSPTREQRRLFEVMVRAQQAAIDAIRPGVRCREVDRAARQVIEEAGYGPQFTHRTGHGIGIEIHEAPYFSASDDTVLQPGMVMSVEPGIYVEGVGGFRHSDTVVVTAEGCEVLTKFPKTLTDLVVS
ncbi:MAG: Xaa-Pro peptidase family protein [Armatimonadota bacterium]|nr:Xaa-Pro peptidase family protein [Armatimonadota bacterium]MDR7450685.1 Xaa-Pro peptidase family protein [Armatimonadota bacterium]MDR7466041.1 Xaa-Pro peptidase family protein [Armatimonadota bacterium]MDR7493922.1 Xaa-Pro peptidase family protein [Armatimonadota bacterium]MDR7504027.1 Xaa-Pro peptidase family protein [Armatimonadota bacterium]